MTNLVSHVREAVRANPEATAISVAGNETSYAEFWAMAGRFAGALRERGVGPGDRIALYLPNLPQFVVAFHGVLRAGAIVVPVNPQYKALELRHVLGDSTAGAIVTTNDKVPYIEEIHEHTLLQFMVTADGPGEFSTGFSEFLAESPTVDYWSFADRDDDDVAVLPYTSGTTGDPKGVKLTHGNLRSNTETVAELVPGGLDADDGTLGALPLFHIYGMTVAMNATLLGAGTFYPMAEWDAGRAMSLIDSEQLTVFHGVPAMYNDMVNHPDADEYDLSSLRLAGSGGSGMPVEVLRAFEEQFDATIYEGYGLTETAPVTHFNQPERGRRVGSIGQPVETVDAKVVDDSFEPVDPVAEGPLDDDADLDGVTGEIVVAGPNVMAGYHDAPEATDEVMTEADGKRWFHTGDIGYSDADDYFYVVDRRTDVIVTAGYNVYPREVEELLFEHEAVADAAIVGVPDERRGETVKAYVVTVPDVDVTADEIREFCLDNLAEYKHPRVVEFVDALPRTTTGKVKKYQLREEAEPVETGEPATQDAGTTTASSAAAASSADAAGTEDHAVGTATDEAEGEADTDDEGTAETTTDAGAPSAESAPDADAESQDDSGGGADAGTEVAAGDPDTGTDPDAEVPTEDATEPESEPESEPEFEPEPESEPESESDSDAESGATAAGSAGTNDTEAGEGFDEPTNGDAGGIDDEGTDIDTLLEEATEDLEGVNEGEGAADRASDEDIDALLDEVELDPEDAGDDDGEGPPPDEETAEADGDDEHAESTREADGDDPDAETEADEGGDLELQDLSGISEHRAGVLRDAGFESVADLAAASREELADVEGFGDALASRVMRQVEERTDD